MMRRAAQNYAGLSFMHQIKPEVDVNYTISLQNAHKIPNFIIISANDLP